METHILSHQVALILNVSVATVRRYAKSGKLEFTTDEDGKIRLFRRSYIENLANNSPISRPKGRPRRNFDEK